VVSQLAPAGRHDSAPATQRGHRGLAAQAGQHQFQVAMARRLSNARVLLDVLRGIPVGTCIDNVIVWFLEGEFNIISNEFANIKAAPVTHTRRVGYCKRTRAGLALWHSLWHFDLADIEWSFVQMTPAWLLTQQSRGATNEEIEHWLADA
jgi:hypothetical protein